MESAKQRERTRSGHRAGREPRVVAIEYRPVPDAGRPPRCGQRGVLHQGHEWQHAKR